MKRCSFLIERMEDPMKTEITTLLGIKYPIIQGAMAWVSEAHLAAAVGNAGGAGVIASGGREPEWVRAQIQLTKTLTDKPFGVNLVMMDPSVGSIVDIVCEEKVAFVTTGAGNPLPYIDQFKAAGIKVIPVVPNVKLAKRMADNGADAIVIEGMEAGGHIGKLTTMALMTQVIPEVDIPVIVAGGIGDGRGIAAALTMGASGVQMGTLFYASTECQAHPKAKQALVEAKETDTRVTGSLHHHEVRSLSNALTDQYLKDESQGASEADLTALVVGTSKRASIEGDTEWGAVHAGQTLNFIKAVEPCQVLMDRLVADTLATLKKAQSYL